MFAAAVVAAGGALAEAEGWSEGTEGGGGSGGSGELVAAELLEVRVETSGVEASGVELEPLLSVGTPGVVVPPAWPRMTGIAYASSPPGRGILCRPCVSSVAPEVVSSSSVAFASEAAIATRGSGRI